MGKLTIHPEGTPLPPDHPFATVRIFSGVTRQDFYRENPTEQKEPDQNTQEPTPEAGESTPRAGAVDIGLEALKILGSDKKP